MADVFSKRKRSQVMAAIRSKGNKDTELKLAAILRAHGIKGWRRHRPLPGKPDFIFPKHRLAVFVDGCFWHGCRWHCRMPQDNRPILAGQDFQKCRERSRNNPPVAPRWLAGAADLGTLPEFGFCRAQNQKRIVHSDAE